MKRTRDAEGDVELADTFQFVYLSTGQPIPISILLSQYKQQVSLILERNLTPQFLGRLESTSPELRNFVQKQGYWKILFARDFPAQYTGKMASVVKAQLDRISQHPRRNETYWKRYYEYLTKSRADIDAHFSKVRAGNTSVVSGIPHWKLSGSTLSIEKALERFPDDGGEYVLHRHPADMKNTMFIFNRLYMLRVDLKHIGSFGANVFTVVKYDPLMTTGECIGVSTQARRIYWMSIDGFTLFAIDDGIIFKLTRMVDEYLVSCSICAKPTNQRCSHCNVIYCSTKCQMTNH
jgi:hypothetical protein